MAGGARDLLAWFAGWFSPTSIAPDKPGEEFTLPENRAHFTFLQNRAHYTLSDERAHFTYPDEDLQ